MGLETATYVSQLIASNPENGDLVKEGDNHLRLVKSALRATFPFASNPIYFDRPVAAITSDTTIVNATDGGKIIPCDADSAAFTVTLPATPTDQMSLVLVKTDYSKNAVTVAGNGKTINGETSVALVKAYQKVRLIYSDALAAWIADLDTIIPIGNLIANVLEAVPNYVNLCNAANVIKSGSATYTGVKYKALYQYCWENFSDTVCAVTGGRGASSSADFDNLKLLSLPNMRGQSVIGKLGTANISIGTFGGAANTTLTRDKLPNVVVNVNGVKDASGSSGFLAGTPANLSKTGLSAATGSFAPDVPTGTFNLNGNVTQQPVSLINPNLSINWHMAY